MKKRLISSIIGLTVLLLSIWKIDTFIFVAAISILCFYTSYEILDAVKNTNKPLFASSVIFATSVPYLFALEAIARYHLLFIAGTIYLLVISLIMLKDHKNVKFKTFLSSIFGSFVLPLCFSTICRIGNAGFFFNKKYTYGIGIYLTVFAFCCSWLTDTFAYIVGSKLGKHKLCPEISPKKSVEGAVGGFVLSIIFNFVIYIITDRFIISLKVIPMWIIIVLSGILSILSMIGDLTASIIKRDCGIKDFGNIMPGHGGMMDRFDSCIFVFPTLYFVLYILNNFECLV